MDSCMDAYFPALLQVVPPTKCEQGYCCLKRRLLVRADSCSLAACEEPPTRHSGDWPFSSSFLVEPTKLLGIGAVATSFQLWIAVLDLNYFKLELFNLKSTTLTCHG